MIIFRYLARELAGSLFAVTIVLLMILMSGRLIRQLAAAAAGEVSLDIVFFTLLLRLPSFLEMILPLALFISILLTYGRLYAESEMTVLTATGFSSNRLLAYTAAPAFVLMLVVGSFSLYLSPSGAEKMESLYEKQAQLTEFELLAPGRFQSMKGGSRVTYAESLSDDKTEMNRVFITDGNSLLLAQKGTQYVSDETGSRYLELHDGKRYDWTPGSLAFEALDFELYGVKIAEELEERRQLRKEAVPTLALFGSDDPKHQAQLQWRISMVLMVPIMTLLAVPLSRVNPRQGRFARLFPAIVLFMVYISLLIAMKGMLEKGQLNPNIGLWSLHLVYLMIALGLLLVPEWMRRWRVRSL
ncbi:MULTISPECIES: LPS export ABC transporter permease LptF [unclassified Oceanobacter]|uniref:LPS export ABC transporter permease LptF n=1 Tax=unclassified Oceanobacter TaxID=2620260 RepID=UPI0026E41936|nr:MULTISPECIES: LPS export ABC transporter permease LptF [unclassified Oceanobacter]MDO6681448.1 LPS export ABC transporter permease LptF [Oceanobacter sp. 5_MG-2023]MDP2506728.1 LPS export ABC transporter permease LptF [Oceanobacter sp. 3_MG-2023]MDP2548730.1 LPS export ABC transporter permease LptF [Oceanobacter sp. 4_MG-2023]MDP2609319.1 LPS export ABC transporter permease LptF [Oceanobacter sp. 1_MG-2023]MDP2612584.1 LPS export ABC transporter permease LptF [Oceanobacter sp. 2_MG-2023]